MRVRMKLYEVITSTETDDKILLFGQFLDDFRHADISEKKLMLEKEPPFHQVDFWFYVLPATAEELALENDLPVPEWCLKDCYISPEPLYGRNVTLKAYQDYLREHSLPSFAKRNLFMGDNVLARM